MTIRPLRCAVSLMAALLMTSAFACLPPSAGNNHSEAEVRGGVVAEVSAGSTYYVSPSGHDSNPGTREAPWATPGYGSRQLSPGDTLIILGGRYPLSVYDADIIKPPSGTPGAWISVKGEVGNRPVLAGGGNLFSAVDISGISYIRIENLEITSDNGAYFRTGIAGSGGPLSHVLLKDLYIHHCDEGGIDFADVYDLQILDCRISYCGFGAIGGPSGKSGWRNVLISGCELSYSGHYYQGGPGPGPYDRPDGFGIEPSAGPIEIAYTQAEHNRGDGLDSKADNTNIHHCEVANNRCDGVKLWGDGSKVANTLIYGTGDGTGGASPWAGMVIGTDSDPGAHFEVTNVTIQDNPDREAYPIYVQYGSATPISLLLRNTIISNGYGLAYFEDSVDLKADHNIFHRPGESSQVYANGREYTVPQLESGELGEGNLSRDPLFLSPAWGNAGDYRLQAGSPAIDAGTSLGAPLDDLTGSPRPYGKPCDMGAYEWSASGSASGLSQVFYFAEGYTGAGFDEYLCLGNPGDIAAHGTVTYMFTEGSFLEEQIEIPAGSRSTIYVNASVGEGREVSALVETDLPIAAERPMYFTYKGTWSGGHNAPGARSPASVWYFAEGYTGVGFHEWLCIMNPGDSASRLEFRFQTQEAGEVVRTGITVPPHSRTSFLVNDILGEGYQASLELRSDVPVVAERSMYFAYAGTGGNHWQGGHCVAGAVSLSTRYYFAEGTTRSGFEEWLTIQNPNPADIMVNASYQLRDGQGEAVDKDYSIAAGSRLTVFVPQELGAGKDVSVLLSSTLPFLAERPMYFDYHHRDIAAQGGHCAAGIPYSSEQWYFAEGYTGAGYDEWLCLQNPASTDALVRVTYLTQEARTLPEKEFTVPAGSRVTVMINDDAGAGYQLSCGIRVISGPGIVAERPVYFIQGGRDGGHI